MSLALNRIIYILELFCPMPWSYGLLHQSKMDSECLSLNDLNDDCLIHIFGLISEHDRLDLELVCQRWEELSLENRRSWKSYRTLDITAKHLGYQFGRDNFENVFTVELCQRIVSRCFSFLTRINLSGARPFSDSDEAEGHYCLDRKKLSDTESKLSKLELKTLNDLKTPLSLSHNIEELYLSSSVMTVDDEFLKQIFKNNRKLRIVELSGCHLTGELFPYLSMESLESIEFSCCTYADIDYRDSFASSAPKLQSLTIEYGDCDFVVVLLALSSSLIRLDVTGHYDSVELFLCGICDCKNLTSLILRDVDLNDYEMTLIIDNCKKIIVLDLMCLQSLTDVTIYKTRSLGHLKKLGIGFNRNFTDAGLVDLSEDLLSLDLADTDFSTSAILYVLRKMLFLEKLHCEGLFQVDKNFLESAIDIARLRQNQSPLMISGLMPTALNSIINNEHVTASVTVDLHDMAITIKPQMCRKD